MAVPDFDSWLAPQLGNNIFAENRDDGSTRYSINRMGEQDALWKMEEGRADGGLGMLRGFYDKTFAPDAQGRLPYGTSGLPYDLNAPTTANQGPVNLNGREWARTGSSLAGDLTGMDPEVQQLIRSWGPADSWESYDEGNGYLMDQGKFMELTDLQAKLNNSRESWMDSGLGLTLAMAALAAGGAALAGMGGAGAAGGAGALEAGGAVGAGSGASAGGLDAFLASQGSFAPQVGAAQMSLAPSAVLGTPGAGALAAAGGGAANFADSYSPSPLDSPNPMEQFNFPGEAPSPSMSESMWNLQPEVVQSGAPLAGTGAQMSMSPLDYIRQLASGFDPKQTLMKQLAQFGLKGITGGGEGGEAGSGFGINQALSVGSGIYGLMESRRLRELAEAESQRADPFGPYRPQYAQQLSRLSSDPSSIYEMPGYKAGEQAVERRMASQGYTGSGNARVAMQKYGGDFYNDTVARTAQLAGAGFGPGAGSQIRMAGEGNALDLASRSLASIGYGFGRGNSNSDSVATILSLLSR